jgi:hypothetical protein
MEGRPVTRPTVVVRCHRCGATLATLTDPPAGDQPVRVRPCRQHHGARPSLAAIRRQFRRYGRATVSVGLDVPAQGVRDAFAEARRLGRPYSLTVRGV